MKKILITLLTLTLAFTFISCNNTPKATTATIKANGSIAPTATAKSLSAKAADGAFASGDLKVNGQPLADKLKPVPTQASTTNNNIEFEAKIEVSTPMIELSAEPKEGFVFDEWELDKEALKKSTLSKADKKAVKKFLNDENEKAETITIDARFAEFFKATFDHGFYVDFNATAEGKGTKANPFNSIDQLIAELKKPEADKEELTLKIAKNSQAVDFDITRLANVGLEEVTIIGGFDATNGKWSYEKGSKTLINSLVFQENGKELELEIEHVSVNELDLSKAAEIELDDVEVTVTLKASDNQTVGNIDAKNATITGANLTFVNSVAPSVEGNTYIHSIVTGATPLNPASQNNIIINGAEDKLDGNNYVLNEKTELKGFTIASLSEELKAALKKAIPLNAEKMEENPALELVAEYVEDDVFGTERPEPEAGKEVFATYGPVEL